MKNPGRTSFAVGSLIWFLALAGCRPAPVYTGPTLPLPPTFTYPATREAGESVRTLTVGGLERTYLLRLPPGFRRSALPLVLVFHGLQMSAESMMAVTGFNSVADTGGFILAYPNGTGPAGAFSFNSGLCCGAAWKNNVDEAAFVREVIADVSRLTPVDPARIYAAGFSNGAMLAYRLGCELSDTIAAIAPVAGNLAFGPCRPRDRVSVLHIQGASDASTPYDNTEIEPDTHPYYLSVRGSVAFWASADGCSGYPAEELEGAVSHAAYSGCAAGTAVELYTLTGLGHLWPSDGTFPASQTIWDFFAAHPKT